MTRTHLRWDANASPVVPAAPPAAPGWVTAIAADAAATVSWGPAASGGAARSYIVTPYIAGSPQAATTVAAPASSASITGLTNGTAYTFGVQVLSQAGTALSPMSGSVTPLANLIFGDEFNGTVIDPAWVVHTRDGDQSNGETSYYLPSQVTLDGANHMTMTVANSPVTAYTYSDANPPGYQGTIVTRPYTSGFLQWRSFSFTYGKLQVSAKMPNLPGPSFPQGGWPALVLFGANCQATYPLNPDNVGTCSWPNAGSEEIDVAEFRATTLNYNAKLQSGGTDSGGVSIPVTNPDTTFHTYEVDWSAGLINWLLDGTPVGNSPWTTAVPSGPMFLYMVTATQGTITAFTQPQMIVDWVRVFHN